MSSHTNQLEMPAMPSCSRSAKWAWDRAGGGRTNAHVAEAHIAEHEQEPILGISISRMRGIGCVV